MAVKYVLGFTDGALLTQRVFDSQFGAFATMQEEYNARFRPEKDLCRESYLYPLGARVVYTNDCYFLWKICEVVV